MKTVFISAGHGGGDPGAVSPDHKYVEAELALRLRDAVATRLRSWSVPVITDGRDGENKALRDAVELAKRYDGPAVEIHFNSASFSASGVEVLCDKQHKSFAQALARAISKWTKGPLRGEQGWKSPDSGQHHRLAFCEAGGLIVEVAFLSNPADAAAAVTYEEQIATAIAAVLADAVNSKGE